MTSPARSPATSPARSPTAERNYANAVSPRRTPPLQDTVAAVPVVAQTGTFPTIDPDLAATEALISSMAERDAQLASALARASPVPSTSAAPQVPAAVAPAPRSRPAVAPAQDPTVAPVSRPAAAPASPLVAARRSRAAPSSPGTVSGSVVTDLSDEQMLRLSEFLHDSMRNRGLSARSALQLPARLPPRAAGGMPIVPAVLSQLQPNPLSLIRGAVRRSLSMPPAPEGSAPVLPDQDWRVLPVPAVHVPVSAPVVARSMSDRLSPSVPPSQISLARARVKCVDAAYAAVELAQQHQCAVWLFAPGQHEKVVRYRHLAEFIDDGSADIWANYPDVTVSPMYPFNHDERKKAAADALAVQELAAQRLSDLQHDTHVSAQAVMPVDVQHARNLQSNAVSAAANVAPCALVPYVPAQLVSVAPESSMRGEKKGVKLAVPVRFEGSKKDVGSVSHWLHKMKVYLQHGGTPQEQWLYIADSYLCGSAETTWGAARTRREKAGLPEHTWEEFCAEMISLHGELFVAQAARLELKQFKLPHPLTATAILEAGRLFRQKAAVVADNPGPMGRVCPCDEDTLVAEWMLMLQRGGVPGMYLHTTCFAAMQAQQIDSIASLITLTCKTVSLGIPAGHAALAVEAGGGHGVKRERSESGSASGSVGHREHRERKPQPQPAAPRVPSTTGGYVHKDVFDGRVAKKLCGKCASAEHMYAKGGCPLWKEPKPMASGPAPSG